MRFVVYCLMQITLAKNIWINNNEECIISVHYTVIAYTR